VRSLGIASLLTCLSLTITARADETLTLDLPPSHANSTVSATMPAQPSSQSKDAAAFAAFSKSRATQKPLPSRGGKAPALKTSAKTAQEKVVGRLGVAAKSTSIRAGRGSSKRLLAKVQNGTYLAINNDAGDYYGILMADHSTGWVPKRDVKILNYEVVGPAVDAPQARYANYGGSDTALLGAADKSILDTAYSFLGVPYRWGGTSPDGMDCSAFVQRCFGTVGLRLPRTAREQILVGMPIEPSQLRACDRLYFASRGGAITHTGIYIGNGYFIHSSSSRKGVAVSNLNEPMYNRMFAGARR
jgi:cell wall-associated NlpC family hydrolase